MKFRPRSIKSNSAIQIIAWQLFIAGVLILLLDIVDHHSHGWGSFSGRFFAGLIVATALVGFKRRYSAVGRYLITCFAMLSIFCVVAIGHVIYSRQYHPGFGGGGDGREAVYYGCEIGEYSSLPSYLQFIDPVWWVTRYNAKYGPVNVTCALVDVPILLADGVPLAYTVETIGNGLIIGATGVVLAGMSMTALIDHKRRN